MRRRTVQSVAEQVTFPIAVLGLLTYPLHTFVVRLYGTVIEPKSGMLAVTALLWCLSLSTYIRLRFTGPGHPSNDETKETIYLCDINGKPRMCSVCDSWKPDRCHHCRRCNRCVLKMDHHCPWIGGCVGQHNHKLFYLFLVYTTSYVWYMTSIIWKPLTGALFAGRPVTFRLCWTVYKLYLYTLYSIGVNLYRIGRSQRYIPLLTGVVGWEEYNIHWVIMLFFAIVFSILLSGFTAFHSYCILCNKTTIEYVESRRPYYLRFDYRDDAFIVVSLRQNLYDDGLLRNWRRVMGDDAVWWAWPSAIAAVGAMAPGGGRLSRQVYEHVMAQAEERMT